VLARPAGACTLAVAVDCGFVAGRFFASLSGPRVGVVVCAARAVAALVGTAAVLAWRSPARKYVAVVSMGVVLWGLSVAGATLVGGVEPACALGAARGVVGGVAASACLSAADVAYVA